MGNLESEEINIVPKDKWSKRKKIAATVTLIDFELTLTLLAIIISWNPFIMGWAPVISFYFLETLIFLIISFSIATITTIYWGFDKIGIKVIAALIGISGVILICLAFTFNSFSFAG